MENKSKRELFSRLLLIFGGATALIFGLSTALIPNLAYVQVTIRYWPYEQMFLEYLAFNVQLHESSFGLLISSFGGFLGLLSAVRRNVKGDLLGFAGGFLGVLGVLFYSLPALGSAPEVLSFYVSWMGFCSTLIGVSVMFIGSMVKSEGWHRLTLLGIPLLLALWVTCPLLVATGNFSFLISIRLISFGEYRSIGLLFWYSYLIGLVLTHLGTVIGLFKSITQLTRIPYSSR